MISYWAAQPYVRTMFKRFAIPLLAAISGLTQPTIGWAQSGFSLADVADIALVPGWRTKNATHMAAIRITLAPGWKTYWRAPGEAGIPPQFNWQGSENLGAVKLHWPTPQVFDLNGLRTIGYSGTTLIPVELTPASPGSGPISLSGKMDFGVCEEICVPVSISFQADLPASGAPDPAIRASLANRPVGADRAGVGKVTCNIEPISDGLRLSARIDMPAQGGKETVVVELPDKSIWVAEAVSTRNGRNLTAVTDLVPPGGAPFFLDRSTVRFTVLAQGGAVDISGCSAG